MHFDAEGCNRKARSLPYRHLEEEYAKKNKLAKPTLAESKSAIAFGAAFLLMCVGGIYAVYHVSSSRSVRPDLNQVPVYFKQAKDATPFPSTLDPAQFQIANVREAYSVAKESRTFSHSSLVIAIASAKGIAVCSMFRELALHELQHLHQRGSLGRSATPTR